METLNLAYIKENNLTKKYQLKKNTLFTSRKGPLLLIILDGLGIGPDHEFNAVQHANTPNLDKLLSQPHLLLKAHGTAVGMPTDQDMGNSEVGHNTIGGGRVVDQGATLVNNAIQSKAIFNSTHWKNMITQCQNHQSTFHLMGLLSDGNVHAHINHIEALLKSLDSENIQSVRLHMLLDGRDVHERSALTYVNKLEMILSSYNQNGRDYHIASGGGRMITTMDRYESDWTIVENGWKAHVLGVAENYYSSAKEAIENSYINPEINDQIIPPFVITKNNEPLGPMRNKDCVLCFNFRGDRAIQISEAFDSQSFPHFDRKNYPDVYYCGMLEYDGDRNIPQNFLIDPPLISPSLGDFLADSNIRSFAISETQKYGHVTFFWNGNKSGYINETLEKYIEIRTPNYEFNKYPEMKSTDITNQAIELIESQSFDFGRINFPNPDMVGHTGDFEATKQSVEACDKSIEQLLKTMEKYNGTTIIVADHGNADDMGQIKNGEFISKTSHTLNPVPFIIVDNQLTENYELNTSIETPGLSNIAATICELLGFMPADIFDKSLIKIKY